MAQLKIGDPAPNATLLTATGETVELSSIWDTRPTLLTFLRHFG